MPELEGIQTMIKRPNSILLSAALVALFNVGCGDDPPAPPGEVASFCTVGTVECEGNYLAECIDAGRGLKLTACGLDKTCTASPNADCQEVVCTGGKGARTCNGNKVMACSDTGLEKAYVEQTCKSDEQCLAGACVAKSCTVGEKRCGWGALLECKGSWQASQCPAGQHCDSKQKACVALACSPGTSQCDGATKMSSCTLKGGAWKTWSSVSKSCGAGQQCYDYGSGGLCHRKVTDKAAAGPSDAGGHGGGGADGGSSGSSQDITGGVPSFFDIKTKEVVFDPINSLVVTWSPTATPPKESPNILEFDMVEVNYLENEQMLQITGDLDLWKLEIQVSPLLEFQTGTFTALNAKAEKSTVLMNDGSPLPGNLQWRFQSSDYTIKVEKFEDIGGQIKGTFTAEMKDAAEKGKIMYLVNGTFDIVRS